MIWKTTLAFFATLFFSIGINAQDCPQNNISVKSVELRKADGTLFSPTDEYPEDTEVKGLIYATFGGSTTNAYSLKVYYDIYINGEFFENVEQCLFEYQFVVKDTPVEISEFTWNWGDQLEIRNISMRWQTGNSLNKSCPSLDETGAQCYGNGPGFIVLTPLVVNFDFTSSCSLTVNFENLTTGGDYENYTFNWDFGDGSSKVEVNGIFDSIFNHTYNLAGEYDVNLTVSDGAISKSISKLVTVTKAPAAPTGNASQSFCAIDEATVANLIATGENIQWYAGATDGSALASTVALENNTIYYASQTVVSCESERFAVTVTIQDAPNAGTDGTLTVCEGTEITNEMLFAQLGGSPDAGGTWSNEGLVYTYTVEATGTCTTDATATVTVTEDATPNAGTNGTLTVCEGTTPTDAELFAQLGGSPDAGGTWSNEGLVYTYTVEATGTCTTDATATVTVTEDATPNAGTNGTLTVCEGTTPTDVELFAQLGGSPDAGGTWSNEGLVYTYTVEATGTCTTDATATVTVTEDATPNAGTNGTLTVCEGTTPTDAELFAQLGGSPDAGGTWSNEGLVYTYTVEATGTCTTDATATVTVTEDATPNAGTNGTLTVCEGTTPTDAELFAQLGGSPDAGGTWSNEGLVYTYTVEATGICTTDATVKVTVTEDATPNAGTNGTLDVCEGTEITNEMLFAKLGGSPDAGGTWSNEGLVYTYTVEATGTCTTDATATVTVTEDATPNAGTNGTLDVCEGTEITNEMLFAKLGGSPDAGGTWSNEGLVYTYTVEATGTCTTDATATVTVTEDATPNAGTNGTLDVCEGTEITNEMLFAELTGADAGGTWSTPVDGVYTYTVEATAPCTEDATSTVTVTVQPAPNAGTDGTLTVCEGTEITNEMLFAELTGADAGGTWSTPVDGVYTYTVEATAPCTEDATSTVTVTVQPAPNAGTDGTLTVCEGTEITNEMLFAELTDADAGGSWSTPVDGVYTYTVEATAPCTEDATSTVTVTVQDAKEAQSFKDQEACVSYNLEDLEYGNQYFTQSGGEGSELFPGDPINKTQLIYVYSTAEGTCPASESSFTVTINPTPDAPVVAETIQPTCEVETGSFSITTEEGLEYSFNGGDFGDVTSWDNLSASDYTVVARNADLCVSATLTVTINTQPEIPVTPEITATDANCDSATGSITVSNFDANLIYILVNSEEDTQYAVNERGIFTEVAPGTYTVRVENDICSSTSASATIIEFTDDEAPVADMDELPTVTGECSATVSVVPTATDNCVGPINGTTEDPLTYSEQGNYQITWKFNDGNGNVTTSVQNVIVDDVTAPAAITIADATGECEVTVTAPTISDNCNGTITGTTTDPLTYSEQGNYQITWKFNDGNGNSSTAVQNVIVDDLTAPEAVTIADATGECEITVSGPTTSDNCSGTITGTTTDLLTYSEQGNYKITWTFDDGNGNTTTAVQNVIVDDVTAPEATTIADATGECEVTVSAPATSDNCSGTITGTTSDPLTYSEQGNYKVNWTFDDGNGNTTTSVQNVVVDDVTAPTAITIADATGECEVTVSAPTTSDNCSGTITGTTSDPLTYSEQGNYKITWTFDDGNGNTTTAVQNVIVDDVTAPTAITIADATGECEVTVTAPTTSDNCIGTITGTTTDPLTYSEQGNYKVTWTFDDGNGNTSNSVQNVIVDDVTAPEATTIADATGECEITVSAPTTLDNCSGMITGTTTDPLTYSEQGNYKVTWTFDDGNGNTTTSVQNVIVDDTIAPAAIAIADATGECEVTVTAPTTSDNCSGTITGTTSDPLTYTEQGSYEVTWTFDDGNGNTTTSVQDVIVDDVTAPTAITIADATGECEVTVTAPTTSDNCSGTITGTTSDPLTYSEQGNYKITWTFDDVNGNTTTAVQNVIVDDVTAPTAITIADATGECEVTVTAPTTSDNCSGTITGTTSDPLTYSEQGNYKVTWTFDDGNGNTSTSVQNVIVDDVTAPTVITIADATGECEVTVSAPTTSDNCSGTITGTTTDPLTYTEQGSYEVTWTFDDGNGNTTTSVQNVIVDGISAPVLADVVQPGCEVTTGSFTVTTIEGLEYTIDGENFSASGSFEGLEPGVYTVAAINKAGCLSPLTEVVINETASLPAPSIASTVQPTCEINTGSFTVTVEEGFSYSIDGTNYQSGVEFSNLAPGTYNVTAQNEAGCISPATIVTIEESAVAEPIGGTTKSLCVEDQTFDLFDLYNDEIDESGTWEDPGQTGALSGSIIDPSLLEVGNYNFNYVIGGDCPSTTTVAVSINDDCVVLDCDFESIKNGISKVVTPGTDTHNDFFVVDEERECGFTYGVQIFNRWGAEVYSSSNYDNDWNGYSSKSVTGSNQLPSGTYFYIVQIDGGTFEPIQGYIYLGTK